MYKITFSSRGQMVVPAPLRKKLDIKQGTKGTAELWGDGTMVVRVADEKRKPSWSEWARQAHGLHKEIWAGVDPVEYQRKMREDRERY